VFQVHVHVQGSLLEKLRLNIVTETLIAFDERGCDRLFWLGIIGDAIRAKSHFQPSGTSLEVFPKPETGSPAGSCSSLDL
jgi:hypothetical protein